MTYTEKAQAIVNEALAAVQNIEAQIRELKAEYKAERISGEEYRKQMAELDGSRQQLHLNATKQLQAVATSYKELVQRNSELDSSKIHDDARILQMDIKMTVHQFEKLVEKHKDNPLMAQLLQEYSNKHEGLYAGFIPTAERKMEAFDGYINAAQKAIRTPDSLQSAFFQTGKYTPQYCTESE